MVSSCCRNKCTSKRYDTLVSVRVTHRAKTAALASIRPYQVTSLHQSRNIFRSNISFVTDSTDTTFEQFQNSYEGLPGDSNYYDSLLYEFVQDSVYNHEHDSTVTDYSPFVSFDTNGNVEMIYISFGSIEKNRK